MEFYVNEHLLRAPETKALYASPKLLTGSISISDTASKKMSIGETFNIGRTSLLL